MAVPRWNNPPNGGDQYYNPRGDDRMPYNGQNRGNAPPAPPEYIDQENNGQRRAGGQRRRNPVEVDAEYYGTGHGNRNTQNEPDWNGSPRDNGGFPPGFEHRNAQAGQRWAGSPRGSADNVNFGPDEGYPLHRANTVVSNETRLSLGSRNDQFLNLNTFMDVSTNPDLEYKAPVLIEPEPGCILHIRDCTDTAIHGLVVLVLMTSTQGYTCLGFCVHDPIKRDHHWLVRDVTDRGTQNAHRTAPSADMRSLDVVLQPRGSNAEAVRPRPGLTINIREHWTISSHGTGAARLGYVPRESLQRLAAKVKDTFCSEIDRAIPQTHRLPGNERQQAPGSMPIPIRGGSGRNFWVRPSFSGSRG